jgi:glycosyltransferase involved in cell wall biosynthesis
VERGLVSVILPTHNRERYLAAALDSALGQEYRPVEVIVVDDGSTDGTAQIVRSYAGVRYLYQPNQGAAAARNVGVAVSRGEILAFLDSDDLWMPEKLRLQVRFLAGNPDIGYCLTRMQTFVEPGAAGPLGPGPGDLSPPSVGALPTTLVVRREVFDRVGGFDIAYKVGEDIDWFFRAKDAGVPFAVLPETLVRRRLHDGNLGGQEGHGPSPVTNIAKASLDRRRARRLR